MLGALDPGFLWRCVVRRHGQLAALYEQPSSTGLGRSVWIGRLTKTQLLKLAINWWNKFRATKWRKVE